MSKTPRMAFNLPRGLRSIHRQDYLRKMHVREALIGKVSRKQMTYEAFKAWEERAFRFMRWALRK